MKCIDSSTLKLALPLLLPLAIACNGPSGDEPAAADTLEVVKEIKEDIKQKPAEEVEAKEAPATGTVMETEDGREYSILHVDSFPHDWTKITLHREEGQEEEEAQWVVFEPCDASTPTYNFSEEEMGWAIIEGDGHGAAYYFISEIRRYNPTYYELYTICEFQINGGYDVMFTVKNYSPERHTAQWSMTAQGYTSGGDDNWFVNERGKVAIPKVVQPCRECRDNCDE